jgi:hypothetical protein
MSESDKDIANVEAWAEVIEDMLVLMPPDNRIEVLHNMQVYSNAYGKTGQAGHGGTSRDICPGHGGTGRDNTLEGVPECPSPKSVPRKGATRVQHPLFFLSLGRACCSPTGTLQPAAISAG